MSKANLRTVNVPLVAETQGQRLVVEPWAEEYELQVGVHYVLEITGPIGGQPEIGRDDNLTTIHAWLGSTFCLLDQMQNVVLNSDLVVPATPPEMSVNSFLKAVSGQKTIPQEKENPNA
ncbi:hypothetical protein [Deinococcus apachensis]|uniref:hypothetical protein n=1 Tax=Deinococcus apachensis TaxID=309886 RepID=UPI0012F96FF2|nr:hypothetical protein [Deinococcus apachensis]